MKSPIQLALELEEDWDVLSDEHRSQKLDQLRTELSALSTSTVSDLVKLSQLTRSIRPGMTLREFYTVIVPLERYENRRVSDANFLIRSKDKVFLPTVTTPLHTASFEQENLRALAGESQHMASAGGELVVVLDNIRSAFNVGSISRISDCVGTTAIYHCGYTPGPESKHLQKSALGTEVTLPWKYFVRADDAIRELKAEGFKVFALETANASPLYASALPHKTALVLGNERFGLENMTLKLCDAVIEIPTFGIKNSLNVAVCYALTAYEWKKQNTPEFFA